MQTCHREEEKQEMVKERTMGVKYRSYRGGKKERAGEREEPNEIEKTNENIEEREKKINERE